MNRRDAEGAEDAEGKERRRVEIKGSLLFLLCVLCDLCVSAISASIWFGILVLEGGSDGDGLL
jgi:hypothetical protein